MGRSEIYSFVSLPCLFAFLRFIRMNSFDQLKTKLRLSIDRVAADEVNILLALFGLMILVVVVPTALYGEYGVASFRESMWASVNAIIIDLVVGGIILKFLARRGSKRRETQLYLNEIDDFRYWQDQSAAHRIRGNIFRLNRLGTTQIDLTNCYLAQAQLVDVKLINSRLLRVVLEGSDLENAQLQGSDFYRANLKAATLRNADLSGAKLENCELTAANLAAANLTKTSLRDSVLKDVDLTGSILDEADLTGVLYMNPVQLSKARSAVNVKIDRKLLEKACELNPSLTL